ncbi:MULTISPECIES: AMP-binding protein [unclassified Afipia]|uniref:AMP-binding protein n=1 Tax=unclassified Afipia TaxID=2642050 RepID=UPI00040DB77C|nr:MULTISPECIES: AMP-binding protein [unclassified Afipia]
MAQNRSNPRAVRFAGGLPDQYATLPRLLAKNADDWPDAVAIREKKLGIWHEHTWSQALSIARTIALGLTSLGINRGDVVGLVGQNRPLWWLSEIAIHSVGGLSLGIYKDSLVEEVGYLAGFSGMRVVVVEDEEQADKFVELGGRLPKLEHIVVCDLRGMGKYKDPRLVSMDRLMAAGEQAHTEDPAIFVNLVASTRPDDDAILCTTSGTTSNPKLAILRGGPFLQHALAFLESDPKFTEDDYVSVLPLSWIGEQVYAVAHPLISGIKLNFVEDEETTSFDMREINPSCVLYPPRMWEGMAADIRARMFDSTWLKRLIYNFALKRGEKAVNDGKTSFLANLLLGRALRDRLGMARLRSASTGGAPLGPEIFRFFRAIGVPLRQLYGQTELAGVYCGHLGQDVDFDTVGKGFRNVDLRIEAPDPTGLGQILARHPGMFVGYYRNEKATSETIQNGWMLTGDAGYFDDKGHLIVVDRINDLSKMRSGVRFSPLYLENKLKFSPYISECVALGEDRDYIVAVVCIRFSILSKWAESLRIAFNSYSDLSARKETRELIRAEIETVNAKLPDHLKIARFLLLYKELDADDGELTRTRKVRRGTFVEKYGFLIDALYDGRDLVDVDAAINLQDGRTQRIRTQVTIETLRPVSTSQNPSLGVANSGVQA